MSDYDGETSCVRKCCMRGGIIGLILAAILFLFVKYSFFSALLIGIIVAVVVAVILWFLTCRSDGQTSTQPSSIRAPAPRLGGGSTERSAPQAAAPAEEAIAEAAPVEAAEAAPAVDAPDPVPAAPEEVPATPTSALKVQPSKALPGQAELAARKGSWKYEGGAAEAEPAALASETPAPAAAPGEDAPEDAPGDAAKPTRAPVAADGQPEIFDAPQAGDADDLKLISGVGPKLEQTLNELGIWHFSQVAGWRKKEIKWVDDRLRFKGRIERDDWIGQAKVLAKGGETEFSKRKKK